MTTLPPKEKKNNLWLYHSGCNTKIQKWSVHEKIVNIFVVSNGMHNARRFTHIIPEYRLWQGRQLGYYHFQHNYILLKHMLLHQTEVRAYMWMMTILWSIVCDIWEMRSSWMSPSTPTSAPASRTVLITMGPRYGGYSVISRVWRICNIKCHGNP